MTVYSRFAERVVYPLGDAAMHTGVMKYLSDLEKSQWWSPDELTELQNRKLRALVEHACRNVPYYRRVFAERGLSAGDIRTVEDLPRLPILTKDLVRRNSDDLMARDFRRWRPSPESSSGSTGEPLRYYTSLDARSIGWAGAFRSWRWAGYRMGDRRVTMAGTALIPSRPPSLLQRLRWSAERNLPLSAVHLDQDTMALYARRLRRYRPQFLRGYATALYLFADYLGRQGISIPGVKAVFTTAEMLPAGYRRTIESQFACPVFDQYGCIEGGPQALECATREGYHITMEKSVMEFVDRDGKPAGKDTPADIIATDLHNYAMPFIRYAVGDRAVPGGRRCSCGRGLPLIRSLEGRTTDVITLDNGVALSGVAVTGMFSFCKVKQFQVVQTGGNSLLARVVPGEGYSWADTDFFTGLIRSHVGQDVEIKVEHVDEIAPTKAGKHEFIISRLSRQSPAGPGC